MTIVRLLALALTLCAAPAAARWPNGAKAAVGLTYDDALTSQLDIAAPALDRAGLKGTFFLSTLKREHVDRWRALARKGHELANHSLFHPCPAASFPADSRYTSEAYTPAQMVREIERQEVLLTALDGRQTHGFASPCVVNSVNGHDYLAPLTAAGIVSYARSMTDEPGARSPVIADPMRIAGRSFDEAVTGAQLIAYAQEAVKDGGTAVYVFHGVGGDYLQTSAKAHEELLAWLRSHKEVWVAPLGEIVAWSQRHPRP
jgi:peptidoglycan/xylan/chitin deacetylase (PgdA/CDA1 family)